MTLMFQHFTRALMALCLLGAVMPPYDWLTLGFLGLGLIIYLGTEN